MVSPTFLTVAVVSPAVDLAVLQDRHAAGLAAGDSHHLPPTKRGAHFPEHQQSCGRIQCNADPGYLPDVKKNISCDLKEQGHQIRLA